MRWIHLSDLHIDPSCDGRSTEELRKELINYIKKHDIKADHLFLTGDYRNAKHTGTDTDSLINTVADFIINIAKAANVNPSNVHFVPGNHDLYRTKDIGKIQSIKENYQCDDGKFASEDLEFLLGRFTYFTDLCHALAERGATLPWSDKLQPLHPYLCFKEFNLLYLNTCLICNSDEDRHNLIIGNYDLYHSLEEICKKNPDKPIIVLAHHGLAYLRDDERMTVENLFRKYPVKLYLCGDTHNPWTRRENQLLEITMGCSVVESGTAAVFSVGELKNDSFSVEAYKWEENFSSWQPFSAFNECIHRNRTEVITKLYPILPSTHFTGRESELEKLKNALRDDKIVLLHGMGGIGKTEICRQLFQQYLMTSDTIHKIGWISYQNSIKNSFWNQFPEIEEKRKIAEKYSIPTHPKCEELSDSDTYWQESKKYINKHGHALLLIIDNANEITNPEILLLKQLDCKIILTSRKKMDKIRCIDVAQLNPENCRELYRIYSQDYTAHDKVIDSILALVSGHTLLTELLAKLQYATGMTAEEMHLLLKKEGFDLSEITESISYLHNPEINSQEQWDEQITEHIKKLFNISEVSQNQEKMQILQFFSLLSPGCVVPMRTAKKWMNLQNLNAVNALVDGGWLKRSTQNGIPALTMHPLVYMGICHMMTPTETAETIWIKNVADDTLIKDNETAIDKVNILPLAEVLMSKTHIRSIEYIDLMGSISAIYINNGEYKKSLEFYNKLLETEINILGKEHPYIAKTYNSIALVYDQQRKYEDSLIWFKKGTEMSERTMGPTHIDTIVSYCNVATTYMKLQNLADAKPWLDKAYTLLTVLPEQEDCLEKATIYVSKGLMCLMEKLPTQAITWYQKALDIYSEKAGKTHPNTMAIYGNIAAIYHAQGKCTEALAIYHEIREVFERTLSEKHPNKTYIYRNIGNVYRTQKKYRNALEWYEKTVRLREEVFGKEHILTGFIYNDIGIVHFDQGRPFKALKDFKNALSICIKELGKNDYNTQLIYCNIKKTYMQLILYIILIFIFLCIF